MTASRPPARVGAYRGLLFALVRRDLFDRHAGAVLGPFWSLATPLAQVAIFATIFGSLFAARLPGGSTIDYATYLVAGVIPWSTFATAAQRVAGALADNKAMIAKTPAPLAPVVAHAAVSEALILVVAMSAFLGLRAIVDGAMPPASALLLPLLTAATAAAGFAVGLVVAIAGLVARDARDALAISLQFWFWLTPIVYVREALPDWAQAAQAWNPAAWLLGPWRQAFAFGVWPAAEDIALAVCGPIAAAALALALLRRLERAVRDLA